MKIKKFAAAYTWMAR